MEPETHPKDGESFIRIRGYVREGTSSERIVDTKEKINGKA